MKAVQLAVIAASLTLGGCNINRSTISYQAVTKPSVRPQLTINPELLVDEGRTPAPSLAEEPSPDDVEVLHQRAIIFGSDAARYQGKFTQLSGAIKQREHSEAVIMAAEREHAERVQALVDKLNADEAKRAKPWWRFFAKD